MTRTQIRSGILGLAVGDALGVPVEFRPRIAMKEEPLLGMRGRGSHGQRTGTWSDDTSLTLALMDGLIHHDTHAGILERFCRWFEVGEYTAWGEFFDIGWTTREALSRFREVPGIAPEDCGGKAERSNGNGSLMRILPMAFVLREAWRAGRDEQLLTEVHAVSALTHGHLRSCIACGIYVLIALELLEGAPLPRAISAGLKRAQNFYMSPERQDPECDTQFRCFNRLLRPDFASFPEEKIESSGYVVSTLEAALWSLWNTETFEGALLKAVNLGGDTDTVGAVTGGLAGLAYGLQSIPEDWLDVLPRREYIETLCDQLADVCAS